MKTGARNQSMKISIQNVYIYIYIYIYTFWNVTTLMKEEVS